MLDRIIVNAIYLVPFHVHNFKKKHPDDKVIIADGTKARMSKSKEESQYEMGWVTARRSVLMLTTEGLYCGDWHIPISSIQEANLLQISGGSLLKISTTDGLHYQFGMQRNPAWEEQKVFPLTVQSRVLKFSKISFFLRLVLLAWLVYIFVQDYLRAGLNILSVVYLLLLLWIVFPMFRLLKLSKLE